MIVGLIPAAGSSSRMGRPKLALPLGGQSVLERVVQAVRSAGVDRIVVVVGPQARELATLAQAAGAECLPLPEGTPDMRATVEFGLAWLEASVRPTEADDWLLLPADHPTLSANVVSRLLAARAALSPGRILIPMHGGRRGHPTLIGWRHVAGIRALPAGLGLNSYIRSATDATICLEVEDASVLEDLDTPEDYERIRGRWANEPQ
jgi:molybdenum cofactor cytidylyltransferase